MADITPLIRRDAKVIQSYRGGEFRISDDVFTNPVLVFPNAVVEWNVADVDKVSIDDFASIIAMDEKPEVLLLGCGTRQFFIQPQMREALRFHGLTVDAMDTGAACRTYNVLLAEGRRVLAALLPYIQ